MADSKDEVEVVKKKTRTKSVETKEAKKEDKQSKDSITARPVAEHKTENKPEQTPAPQQQPKAQHAFWMTVQNETHDKVLVCRFEMKSP